MKLALFSKTEVEEELKQEVKDYGFEYSEKNPDFVISMGGDGTYLRSERKWPGVPKLIVKHNSICRKCEVDTLEKAFEELKKGNFEIKENIKLEARVRRKKITCVNEFSIRNMYATTAIRFYVWIDGERTDEIIGDGVIIATPFGSTGYYKSVGGKEFEKGIGIGFNNPTEKMKHLVVPEDSEIKVKITRGDAVFSSDNDPRVILLKKDEDFKIKKSKKVARLVDIR